MKKILIIAFSFILFSCGYQFQIVNLSKEVKSVQVSPFNNYASIINPNLAQSFTQGLQDQFIKNTSLELTNYNGDIIMEGEITNYAIRATSIQANSAAESRLTISVKVNYTNTKEDDKDFSRTFTQYEDFSADADFSAVEESLVQLINERLINDIFNAAVADW